MKARRRMEGRAGRCAATLLATALLAGTATARPVAGDPEDLLVSRGETARRGGRLVALLRSEPKTLNPVTNTDIASRDVIGRTTACLVCIDRETQLTTPGLARSWTVSSDGRRLTVALRRGIRFSDGQPFDADDVVFTFQAYQDERNNSPQRDLLFVGGKPIAARKIDSHTVAFEMEEPYAVAERLFDGIAILPRHLLLRAQQEGKLAQAWGLGAAPAEIAGLGPFRLKAYVPGDRLVLERNPYYWKADRKGERLPYLDEITFLFVASDDAQVMRFQAGEADVVSRPGAENFALLAKDEEARGYHVRDLGPGLEYSFLFFNLGDLRGRDLGAVAQRQGWWKDVGFRRAVSLAVDREGMVRLAFQGRATALGSHVTPGNRLWVNPALGAPRRSLESARELLKGSGFSWQGDGTLVDPAGRPVEFSIVTNASNPARVKMAAIIQDDLRQLGMNVHVAPLEMRSVIDRVLQTRDYDACILSLGGGGDADPNVEMNVWLSSGPTHLWNPAQSQPATPWEADIDRLMRRQLTTIDHQERKRLYDRVQELVAENLPLIPLVAPHVIVGAKRGLVNFRPAILDPCTLWNADELGWPPPVR